MLSIFNLAIFSAVTGAMLIAAVLILVLYKCWRKIKGIPNSTSDCRINCFLQYFKTEFSLLSSETSWKSCLHTEVWNYTNSVIMVNILLNWLALISTALTHLQCTQVQCTHPQKWIPPNPIQWPHLRIVAYILLPSPKPAGVNSGIHVYRWHTCIYGYRHGLCCCILTEQHYLHMLEYVSSLTTAWYFWCIHNIS